jgi:hypothetical protein
MKKQIVVTCSSPMPRMCGGVLFSGAKAYPADTFTAEQLKAIIADRMLTVVVGEVLEADGVDAFLKAAETSKGKAA